MKKIYVITSVLLIGLFILGSCGKDKEDSTVPEVKKDEFTFLFYADTRGDPRFTNWFQVLHKKFVKKVLEYEKENGIQHLVFGGDSVLMGFFNPQWKLFFKVMKAYVDQGIKIFPAIGNHELWLSRCGFAVMRLFRKKETVKDRGTADLLDRLSKNMAEEKELEKLLSEKSLMEALMTLVEQEMADPSFEADHKEFLEQLEKEFAEVPSDIFKEIGEIYNVAQEVSLTQLVGKELKAGQPSPNWERFEKYVKAWPHLWNIKQIKENNTSYYSFKLPDETNAKIKVIILDSNNNMIKDAVQKEWFMKELQFDGPVLVACHHPIFCDAGWFKDQFAAGGKVPPHFALVGHVHDYERLPAGEGNTLTPPVYIVSGSGGAYLESGGPHCSGAKHKNWFNYTRITVKEDTVRLKVFGCEKMSDPLTVIDELEFKWK